MACHWWPLPILLLCYAGIGVGIYFLNDLIGFTSGKSSPLGPDDKNDVEKNEKCQVEGRNQFYDKKDDKCKTCPNVDKEFAVFWESQVDGCEKFYKSDEFKYVTTVIWGFAEVKSDGTVDQKLQGNKDTLQNCIDLMRTKCVKQYVSVGGASARKQFKNVNTPEKQEAFAKSVATLVETYNLDGVDIDDESGNSMFDGNWNKNSYAVDYLKKTRDELDQLYSRNKKGSDQPYGLSWAELPFSLDQDKCSQPGGEYTRCFNDEIGDIVDEVYIMNYNSENTEDYEIVLKDELPKFAKVVKDLLVGGCVGGSGSSGGCSYGATPTEDQLKEYAQTGKEKYGGTLLWTASKDFNDNDGKAKAVTLMGEQGYGVNLDNAKRRLRQLVGFA